MTPTAGHQGTTTKNMWHFLICLTQIVMQDLTKGAWLDLWKEEKHLCHHFSHFYALGSIDSQSSLLTLQTQNWLCFRSVQFPLSTSACRYINLFRVRLHFDAILSQMQKPHHHSERIVHSGTRVAPDWRPGESYPQTGCTCRPSGWLPEPHCATDRQLTDAHPQWQYNQPKMD